MDWILEEINSNVHIAAKNMCVPHDKTQNKFVFVVGAPRSGTTLLTQVLGQHLGYITNIAARFYAYPEVGIYLSRHILPHARPSLQSSYARTDNAGDINEFGKYWMDGMQKKDAKDFACEHLGVHEWFGEKIRRLSNYFEKPIAMKGIYPAYYYTTFDVEMADNPPIWLHIKRDPVDACISIYNARRETGKSWFGWWPRGDIPEDEFEQIAYQVAWFRNYYDSFATQTLTLEELCTSPNHAFGLVDMPQHSIENPFLKLRRYDNHPLRASFESELEKYQ